MSGSRAGGGLRGGVASEAVPQRAADVRVPASRRGPWPAPARPPRRTGPATAHPSWLPSTCGARLPMTRRRAPSGLRGASASRTGIRIRSAACDMPAGSRGPLHDGGDLSGVAALAPRTADAATGIPAWRMRWRRYGSVWRGGGFSRCARYRDRVRSCRRSGVCRRRARSAGTRCPWGWLPAVRGV